MLVEAWKKFCDYYDTKAPLYQDSWRPPLDRAGALKSNWICWDEYDLTFHIGRFFYDILGKKEELSNIEIHLEKNVSPPNFNTYQFADRLEELKRKLKKWPKVDIIVAFEDSNASFLLCAEVKCFRGTRYQKDPIPVINADIEKLIAIRDCEIAKKAVFILFDDYYWCNDEETANAIQQRLNEIQQQDGITVLFHTSEAKLENY
jgi:hypothetical protein